MKNYYEILGLQQDATEEEIKTAYRKLSLKFHPDKNDGDKYFEEWAKKINEAYETLGNKDKRITYDETLKGKNSQKSNSYSNGSYSSTSNNSSSNSSSNSEYEVLSQIRKLTPEYLNAKYALVEAQYHYNNVSAQSVANKFTATRILFIILLFIISGFGLKKTFFNQTDTSQESEVSNPSKETKKTVLPEVTEIIGEPIDDVGNSILYTNFSGIEENEANENFAVPIAMFYNNKYIDPPTCEHGSNEQNAINECEKAKELLLPSVRSGSELFVLDNGKQSYSINVIDTKEFGYSDWTRFSARIREKPKTSILTDNPKIGTNKLFAIKDRPTLEKRKDPEGNVLQDKLLSKVDIDGDGMPELIYECSDYEGTFYQIYSNKNGKWIKVYEGGYQGF